MPHLSSHRPLNILVKVNQGKSPEQMHVLYSEWKHNYLLTFKRTSTCIYLFNLLSLDAENCQIGLMNEILSYPKFILHSFFFFLTHVWMSPAAVPVYVLFVFKWLAKLRCLQFSVCVRACVLEREREIWNLLYCCFNKLMNRWHPFHSYLLCAAELETHNVLTECPHFCVSRCWPLSWQSHGRQTVSVFGQSASLGWPHVLLCAKLHRIFIPFQRCWVMKYKYIITVLGLFQAPEYFFFWWLFTFTPYIWLEMAVLCAPCFAKTYMLPLCLK